MTGMLFIALTSISAAAAPITMPPATQPATAPATTAATATAAATTTPVPPAPPMPPEFAMMLTRNVFVRGAARPASALGPESNFGFNGVVADDGNFTAFVEDLGAKRTLRLKAGD